jgi:hypothetical protein
MRVSELIQKLDSLQETNGDCQVMVDDIYAANVEYDSSLDIINITSY